jgi:DNA-binding transcriptional MerR regulator
MSERIMTLFGEEIVPQQPKPAPKTRTSKKAEEKGVEEKATEENIPTENITEEPVAEERPWEGVEENVVEETVPEETITEENILEVPAAEEKPEKEVDEKVVDEKITEEIIPEDIITEEPVTKVKPAKKTAIPKAEEEDQFILPDDWKGEKQYYTIGEVAKLFNVKTSHIRFWTNEFKLKVRTTRKGDRLFTADQIRELRAIHHLVKERGFTLSGAKAKMKSQNKMDIETVDLRQQLLQLRSKLLIIRNQLT